MYGQYIEQFVHCREGVHSSECPLSEVPLYIQCDSISLRTLLKRGHLSNKDTFSLPKDSSCM